MGSVRVKAFILQNSNCTGIASCEDSLAVSVPKGRFAVADGVTNSYHPGRSYYVVDLLMGL